MRRERGKGVDGGERQVLSLAEDIDLLTALFLCIVSTFKCIH